MATFVEAAIWRFPRRVLGRVLAHVNLRALVVAGAALLLAACETTGSAPEIARPQEGPTALPAEGPVETRPTAEYDKDKFVTPPNMQGGRAVRVAILLPFTAPSEAVADAAQNMFNAAQLAAFEAGDEHFLLIAKDTKGDPAAAAQAAQAALSEGAEMILGPLYSDSVTAVAPIARASGVPVIAFSSDMKAAGGGVFLLSFPPELEVDRVTDFAMQHGYFRYGLLAPATDYGQRVSTAFSQAIYSRGGQLVHEERYAQEPDEMLAPAKRLAQYAADTSAEKAAEKATEKRGQPLPARAALEQDGTGLPGPQIPAAPAPGGGGFQAVLLPEQGTLLRALAPLLPYYDVDIKRIKLLGVSGWNDPRLAREPALAGGWFAAPDPEVEQAFENRYLRAFGEEPGRLSPLAYDGTLLAARLARYPERERFSLSAIADPNGYFGADGLFRFTPDGRVERGLAVLEIEPTGIKVIDPAPKAFAPVTGY